MLERRALQVSIAIAALLPVTSGLWDIMHGLAGGVGWADNHHRYLGGLLFAIGLGFWSAIPRIEAKTARIRLLTTLVVIGGLARLLGLALGDVATPLVMTALVMELIVTPLLCLWQAQFKSRWLVASRLDLPGIAKMETHLRHMTS